MRISYLWALLLLEVATSNCTAQISETDKILKFEKDRNEEIEAYRLQLTQDADSLSPIMVEYKTDLYKVEIYEMHIVGGSCTTVSIVDGRDGAYNYYDLLLNKYYNRLLSLLEGTDKEVLRQSQRNWIKYRDSEFELNKKVSAEKYTEGGTLQYIIVMNRVVNLAKQDWGRLLSIWTDFHMKNNE
jgi:uncharacterized protein YecT (DUF1311 family)